MDHVNNDKNNFHKNQPRITFWQGVAIIFGANIGAGILSLPYGAKNGGIPILIIALIVSCFLTSISMLYVAEVSLRTKKHYQLSGLARKYLGERGSWLIFLGVLVNGYGALIAYTAGSGIIINNLFGLPPTLGSILFFIPGVAVVWFGLKATGRSEEVITIAMLTLILILCGWTFFGPGISMDNVSYANPYFIIPIINLTVFAFLAQYTVPELARGIARENPKLLPRAIIAGMVLTATLLALVPFAALGTIGSENITQVVTIAWGDKLGSTAYVVSNVFAILAMLTSFWAITLTLMTNIFDRFNWREKKTRWYRVFAIAIATCIPFLVGIFNLAGFVSALGYAGGFAGAVMAIVPVLMLNKARKEGDQEPVWAAGWISHPIMQYILVAVFMLAFFYSLISAFGLIPDGWS